MSIKRNMTSGPTERCVACDGTNLVTALNLGSQPPANFLLREPSNPFPTYPLGLNYCQNCGHGQLPFIVAPEELFRHYLYASGTSMTLGRFFDWFSEEAKRALPRGAPVLEIACNDGSLLRRLSNAGFATLGIDPAENLAALARDEGLKVISDFWPCPESLGSQVFDLIIGMNVLAHNPSPFEFLCGVRDALSDKGICVIQTSQAHMLINGEFDTIYHEHCSFFTPRSMIVLTERSGLEVRAVNLLDVHGTSFAFVLAKPGAKLQIDSFLTSPPFAMEHSAGPGPRASRVTGSKGQYELFQKAAHARIQRVQGIIRQHQSVGRRICFVGAAAKALVFLHATGIKPDYIYDEAPLKIGRFVPNIGLPILSLAAIGDVAGSVLVVISAWNYRTDLVRKVHERRSDRGDVFMVYFPEIEEFV